jgi:hypothetical protein
MFMNEDSIDEAIARWHGHEILGPAVMTLGSLRTATNRNSDGWAYWPKPSRAASKLVELVEGVRDPADKGRCESCYVGGEATWHHVYCERPDAMPVKLAAALAPLKAFRTRQKLEFDIFTGRAPNGAFLLAYDTNPSVRNLGRDAEGYPVGRGEGMDFRLTECCRATAKGGEHSVICRKCYAPIASSFGGPPVTPYTRDGMVTAVKLTGWGTR